jgi:hypothetical protein
MCVCVCVGRRDEKKGEGKGEGGGCVGGASHLYLNFRQFVKVEVAKETLFDLMGIGTV